MAIARLLGIQSSPKTRKTHLRSFMCSLIRLLVRVLICSTKGTLGFENKVGMLKNLEFNITCMEG